MRRIGPLRRRRPRPRRARRERPEGAREGRRHRRLPLSLICYPLMTLPGEVSSRLLQRRVGVPLQHPCHPRPRRRAVTAVAACLTFLVDSRPRLRRARPQQPL